MELPATQDTIEALREALAVAAGIEGLTYTFNDDHQLVVISKNDEEGRILQVLWEKDW